MTNKAIARVLKETADLVELSGGNPYRARAFSNAARTLERLDDSVLDLLEAGSLTDLRGIGSGLVEQIREIVATGSFSLRDELLAGLPPGLTDMLRVQGLGAKRVRQVWRHLGVTSLHELEAAAATGRLADLDGFGAKMQEKILANTRLLRHYQQRRRYADAVTMTTAVVDALRQLEKVQQAELSGTLRRKLETVAEARVLVATTSPEAVRTHLATLVTDPVLDLKTATIAATLPDGFPLVVRCVPAETFGSTWWRDTGSPEHCRQFEAQHGPVAAAVKEATVYKRVGLPVIPPELREGDGELQAAQAKALPDLVTLDDLHGTLHNHSTYSDGAHSLRAMATAARDLGYAYFGICDHSQSLKIANGLSTAEVRKQQQEIATLNEAFARDGRTAFRIFSGIESDILPDGSLDYPAEVLASFDFVVASVHVNLGMTEQEATERIVRAVRNPYTKILGHPTGRLLLTREGYPLDVETVIDACAEEGVAIEVNANPYRLDLDWRWIRRATKRGVLISINPDAHSIDGLHDMQWGVEAARKGWLTPKHCLNAKPLDDFAAWLAKG